MSEPLRANRHQSGTFEPGTFTPAPGRGSLGRMLLVQSVTETKLALRHGEQALLTLLIPIVLLVGLSSLRIVPLPEPRVAHVVPSILALAVMSTAFTSQAIALGFDRLLVAGRMAAVLAVVVVQMVVLGAIAAFLGWAPSPGGVAWAVLTLLLGCAAFGALGILLGGTLRADIVLAVANLVWFVLLLGGGIVIPAAQLPSGLAAVAGLLPSGALAEGLRACLVDGTGPGLGPVLVLVAWAAVAGGVAVRAVKLR
jgi:ABC-2 type transport system permease protein